MADLRPYGPGKFDTILDSLVYRISLDGGAEEIGSVDELGRYGLIEGPFKASEFDEPITEDEKTFIEAQAGAIVSENDQGFVSVDYYETPEELQEAWDDIEADYAAYDTGEDY